MRKNIKSKLLATILSASMLFSGAVTSYAADYTEDGSATIPINAEVTVAGSYTLSLPAVVDTINTEDRYARILTPITIAWDGLEGKLLAIERSTTLTNGETDYYGGDRSDGYIAYGTEFDESKIERTGKYVQVTEESAEAGYQISDSFNGARYCDAQTTNQTLYNLLSISEDAGESLESAALPAGTYTGTMELTWYLEDIDPYFLQ